MVREDFAGNPFLADSYLGKAESNLPGQLHFLMSRVRRLLAPSWPEQGVRVSDYGFCQDRIFAHLKLSGAELDVYEPLRIRLEKLVKPPDVLVRLTTPPGVLLERIASRGRDFERVMTGEFLAAVDAECSRAAATAECKVIDIDSERVDFRQDGGVAHVSHEIAAVRTW